MTVRGHMMPLRALPDFCSRWHDLRAVPTASTFPNHLLLLRIDDDASVCALGGTARSSLQRHKGMVVRRAYGDAVRIGVRGNILEPQVSLGVDHAHYRTGRHISRRKIVSIVARVVPSLV